MKLPKTNPNEELEQLSKDKLRPLLNISMFEYPLIARLNILYKKIEKEGYREGREAYKSIDNYEYVFTRRKAMFDEKFFRLTFE